jgi:hypothetical protein
MILYQRTKKYQNYIDDGGGTLTTDHHQIIWYWSSNPSNIILIIKNNSNPGVYDSEFQGESEYQLYFSIGVMILWKNTKKHQNYIDDIDDDTIDHHQIARHWPSSPSYPSNHQE